jgi:hypothetical protein
MWEDPIVVEVRKARDEHAAKFGYDLRLIFEDIRRQEKESGRKTVTRPPRAVQQSRPAEKTQSDAA